MINFIIYIIIGGIAGWIASKIMGTDAQMGRFLNVVVGVIGGMIGGWALRLVGVNTAGQGMFMSFVTCLLGAVILLAIVGFFAKSRK